VLRKTCLVLTAVFLALAASRAFWVSLGRIRSTCSPTYVEFFQQLDQRIAIPIAITSIGGTLLAGISAMLYRNCRCIGNR
jgi:hypothetical protein